MQVWTYILQSEKDNKIYIGISSSLRRRIKEHNSGKTKSTCASKPWTLIYKKSFEDYISARVHEKFLKSGKGRDWIMNKLIELNQ